MFSVDLSLTKFVCNQCAYWVRNECYISVYWYVFIGYRMWVFLKWEMWECVDAPRNFHVPWKITRKKIYMKHTFVIFHVFFSVITIYYVHNATHSPLLISLLTTINWNNDKRKMNANICDEREYSILNAVHSHITLATMYTCLFNPNILSWSKKSDRTRERECVCVFVWPTLRDDFLKQ